MEQIVLANQVELIYTRKTVVETIINGSPDIVEVIRNYINPGFIDHKEYFMLICLSQNNTVLNISTVATASIDQCLVDVRIILQTALLSNATGIVISHNHPSGSCRPSSQDIKITRQIDEACKLINIRFLDHIIITSESYLSFADEALIS